MADPELAAPVLAEPAVAHPALAAEPNPGPPGPGPACPQHDRHCSDHPEHRRAAPASRDPARPGDRAARHDVRRGVHRLRRPDRHDRRPGQGYGEDDPPCTRCGAILKSATVMFGQALEPAVFEQAAAAAADCDLMLAVGSTLMVEAQPPHCARSPPGRARPWSSSTATPRPTTEPPPPSSATRSARPCPRIADQLLAASRA